MRASSQCPELHTVALWSGSVQLAGRGRAGPGESPGAAWLLQRMEGTVLQWPCKCEEVRRGVPPQQTQAICCTASLPFYCTMTFIWQRQLIKMAANQELAGKSVLFVFNGGLSPGQLQKTVSHLRKSAGESGSVSLEHMERLGLG